MSSKEEKAQAAAERIKAQALSQAKGLSRVQAELAVAARNVNAYIQKEEGPSRGQERTEIQRQMYLTSTEKVVTLRERKDLDASSAFAAAAAQCQRCLQTGHWTSECKNEPVYISRPLRSQQLKNPKLRLRPSASYEFDNPDVPKREKLDKGEKSRLKSNAKGNNKKGKRKHWSGSDYGSDTSEASVFGTDSGSSVTGSDYSSAESSSSYSSSDSEEERRQRSRRKKKQKRRHRSYSSSSDSSESNLASDSGSDDSYSRRKSSRQSGRH